MPGLKRIEVRRLGVMSEDAESVRVQWGSDLSRTQISRRAWWKDWLALTQATRQWMAVLDHRFHETARIQRVVIPGRRASAGPGIHNHSRGLWIPGSRHSASQDARERAIGPRPGMTDRTLGVRV